MPKANSGNATTISVFELFKMIPDAERRGST
jgi:hypothetical protein